MDVTRTNNADCPVIFKINFEAGEDLLKYLRGALPGPSTSPKNHAWLFDQSNYFGWFTYLEGYGSMCDATLFP